jgi:hypothetical protein
MWSHTPDRLFLFLAGCSVEKDVTSVIGLVRGNISFVISCGSGGHANAILMFHNKL